MTRFVMALAMLLILAVASTLAIWNAREGKGCWRNREGHLICFRGGLGGRSNISPPRGCHTRNGRMYCWQGRSAIPVDSSSSSSSSEEILPEGCNRKGDQVYCHGIPVEPFPGMPGCFINTDMVFCPRPAMSGRNQYLSNLIGQYGPFGPNIGLTPIPCPNPRSKMACYRRN